MGVLEECAEKGVGALVVFTSGFAEVGEHAAQEAMAGLAREAGIRLMGPNCMGMVNFGSRAVGSFHPAFAEDVVPGQIGLVSQSGAFGGVAYMLARERGHSLSYMFTTGNEADVDIGDCTAFLADDPDTKAILLYMEGVPERAEVPRRPRAGPGRARPPVIAVKLGAHGGGRGGGGVPHGGPRRRGRGVRLPLRQFGVYRADSIEEFFDIARSCVIRLPAGQRAGGDGHRLGRGRGADGGRREPARARGRPDAGGAQRRMLELVPFAAARNPIDVTGQVLNDPTLLDQAIELATGHGDYGSVVSFQGSIGRNPALMEATRSAWIERKAANPAMHFAVAGFCTPDYTRDLEAAGIPVYEEATHATRAIAALAGFARSFRERRPRPAVPGAADLPVGPVNELGALAAVAAAGVPVVPARRARTAAEAGEAAAALGFPVVLKVLSADIAHKSDVGGVRLGVADRAGAEAAFGEIVAAGRAARPDAAIDGCLVAPMVTGGVETILGVQRDPAFGPIVMFGLGGLFVEVLKDVTFRAAPFDEIEARAMIESIAAFPVLTGLRGQPPADLDALAAALSRLSCFAAANARHHREPRRQPLPRPARGSPRPRRGPRHPPLRSAVAAFEPARGAG